MKLDMVRPKSGTEDLLLSITKNCETFVHQTIQNHKKNLNLNLPNQEVIFHLHHLLFLVMILNG